MWKFPVPDGQPKKIFISSVFSEPNRKILWPLRRAFYKLLISRGYLVWLWEQAIGSIEHIIPELKKDMLLQGDVIKNILRDRISTSDAIVTFYKNRSGSRFDAYSGLAFEATFHEIELAISHGIPVFLIIIGNTHSFRLRDTLSILDHPNVIAKRYYAADDDHALQIADYQLATYFSNAEKVIETNFDLSGIIETNDALNRSIINQDFDTGIKLAAQNQNFADQQPANQTERYHQAQFFSKMGTIHANRRLFPDAMDYLYKSIFLYMRNEDEWSMTAEIQGLSGVQNMANLANGLHTNAFGFRATRSYPDLIDGFMDARISMYRNQGRFNDAWNLISLNKNYVHSPYRGAKMLSIYANRNKMRSLDFARKIMESEVLPWARSADSSIHYVYMEAGNLAFKDGDYETSKKYYGTALDIALSKGALHTALRVQEKLSEIAKRNKRLRH